MRFCTPTKKQERGYRQFVKGLPEKVRAVAEQFNPWTLYELGHQRVFLHSFAEDGTVTVIVSGRFNHTMMERQVFGVHPDELKECDLPEPDEPLGVIDHGLSLDDMRVMVRPDLWVMRDGKAVRKQ